MFRIKWHSKFFVLLLLPFLFSACNPARKLKEGEYLLTKNKILLYETKVDKNDMETYIKQKPNRKIFKIIPFHLMIHNSVNIERLNRKRLKLNKKLEVKNIRREAKHKSPKTSKRQLFGEWLLDIGEAPVAYDSMLTKRSSRQLKMFLNNKGYFVNSVKDSVYFGNRKKARVYYKVHTAAPYTINNLTYKIPDEALKYKFDVDTSATLIIKRNNYDVDLFQKERERITTNLNNEGYYFFTKDYIYYEVDTSMGNKKVNLTLGIKNFAAKYAEGSDSIVESPHQRFDVNEVYIRTDYSGKKTIAEQLDTIKYVPEGASDKTIIAYFIQNGDMKYRISLLFNSIFIRKGELYQLKNVNDTYKRLQELRIFKSINIEFKKVKHDYLDCYITLSPVSKQSYTIETEGKNTSGNLGIGGSVLYQNRNLLRGAELFELRFKGSLEAQKTIDNSSSISPQSQFNTIEMGPEANIYIPRFLIPFDLRTVKLTNPKTIFTSSYIFQRRPDYYRQITNLSYGYTWKETTKKSHIVNPLVISFVKVDLHPEFYNYINSLNNLYIKNSFINHLSTSTRYSFTYNEQDSQHKLGNFSYFRFNAESSGNILRGFYDLVNSVQPNTFEKDDQDRYKLAGIIYSQYVRCDIDYRFYYAPNEWNKIVWRFAAGIGKPFINLTSLPFERSFFGGGANGIRAWQSRSLGPGSYSNTSGTVSDQFGDGQLEANLEYRFKVTRKMYGAVFLDAGNTWLRQPEEARPGGDFQLNRFYKEIAIGSGVGARADFGFFVIRFDLGVKVRDPQFAESNRWVIQNIFNADWKIKYSEAYSGRKYGFLAFNIGIGYPF